MTSPPVGLPTEAPTTIACLCETDYKGLCPDHGRIKWSRHGGYNWVRGDHYALCAEALRAELERTPVAAEGLIRRLEDARDNACLEGSAFHKLFSDCIAALRAPAAKGRETRQLTADERTGIERAYQRSVKVLDTPDAQVARDARDAARRYGRLLAAADNAFRTWNAEPRGLGPQADSMLKLGKAIAEGAGNE